MGLAPQKIDGDMAELFSVSRPTVYRTIARKTQQR
jgi:hypothetical protein